MLSERLLGDILPKFSKLIKFKLRFVQKQAFHNCIILITITLSLSNCSGSAGNENTATRKVGSSEKIVAKSQGNDKIIYILTPRGKVVDKLKYYVENKPGEYANYIKGYIRSDTLINGYPRSNTFTGDFNGDGSQEIATIRNITYYNNLDDFSINMEACQCVIEFSDESIDALIIESCIEGAYKNEGDLNDDGKDEIGVLPGWFSSGCRQYEVYTYRNNEWIQICDPIENSYNMREAGVVLIEKSKKKGYAVIRQSVDSFMSDPENNISFKYYKGSCCAWSNVVERTIKLK